MYIKLFYIFLCSKQRIITGMFFNVLSYSVNAVPGSSRYVLLHSSRSYESDEKDHNALTLYDVTQNGGVALAVNEARVNTVPFEGDFRGLNKLCIVNFLLITHTCAHSKLCLLHDQYMSTMYIIYVFQVQIFYSPCHLLFL